MRRMFQLPNEEVWEFGQRVQEVVAAELGLQLPEPSTEDYLEMAFRQAGGHVSDLADWAIPMALKQQPSLTNEQARILRRIWACRLKKAWKKGFAKVYPYLP